MKEKLQVLVVEDDSVTSIDIIRVIKYFDCEVVGVARDYRSALVTAESKKIDLLITDIRLKNSDLDGIDAASVIQKRYGVSVIFLTAFSDDETLNKASGVDSVGYLVKPFREKELEILLKIAQNKFENDYGKLVKLGNGFYFDMHEQILYDGSEIVIMTTKERILMSLLVRNIGDLVSYEEMLQVIWPNESVSEAARRQLLFRLKQKVPSACIEVVSKEGLILKK